MSLRVLLDKADSDESIKQNLVECIVYDIQNQLELVDPTNESDDLLSCINDLASTPDGSKFICFLLGVEDLDIYADEILEQIATLEQFASEELDEEPSEESSE